MPDAPYRTAFPNGMRLPSDPNTPLTPEQLAALFPDPEANARFVRFIADLVRQHLHPTTLPVAALAKAGVNDQ